MVQAKQLTIKAGKVNFIFANLLAMGQVVRQTQMNLNRAFRPNHTYSPDELLTYEAQRARELFPYLRGSSALLDLHSSPNPQSTPFVICEPHSYHIAAKLPVGIVSHGWDTIEAGGTDYFVNQNPPGHNFGICIECGYHNDPEAPKRAFQAAITFLSLFGIIKPPEEKHPIEIKQRYIWAKYIYHTQVDFRLADNFADFQPFTAGTLIGYDGEREIRADENCVIVFPQNKKSSGEEAFILGVEE